MTEQTNNAPIPVPQSGGYALVYMRGLNVFIASHDGVMRFEDGTLLAHKEEENKSQGYYNEHPRGFSAGFVQAVNKMIRAGWDLLGAPFLAKEDNLSLCQALRRLDTKLDERPPARIVPQKN